MGTFEDEISNTLECGIPGFARVTECECAEGTVNRCSFGLPVDHRAIAVLCKGITLNRESIQGLFEMLHRESILIGGGLVTTHPRDLRWQAGQSSLYLEHWLQEHVHRNENELAAELERQITPQVRVKWETASIEDWVRKGNKTAQTVAYGDLGSGDPAVLRLDYERQAGPLIEAQLQEPGVRLACVLDEVLR
jgi:S1/P1 Nuclease